MKMPFGVLAEGLPLHQIGLTGFEPATSWSRTKRSSQAELQPVCQCEGIVSISLRKSTALPEPFGGRTRGPGRGSTLDQRDGPPPHPVTPTATATRKPSQPAREYHGC